MTTQEDIDMQNIFSKIEEVLTLHKKTGTMVTLQNKLT